MDPGYIKFLKDGIGPYYYEIQKKTIELQEDMK